MQCTGCTSILFQNTEEVSFETFAKTVYEVSYKLKNVMFFEEEFLETIQSDDYNLVTFDENYKKLNEIISEDFTVESYRADLRKAIKHYKEQIAKLERFEEIVLKMTIKVTNWNPNSEDLIAFKQFMLDQLELTSQKRVIDYYRKELLELQSKLKIADKEYKSAREEQITQLLNSLENSILQLKQLRAQRSKNNLWLKEVYKAIKQK